MSKLEFFYFPPSFYSQKARLSLEEKGLAYKGTVLILKNNEQNQPWYLKLNPNGEVPALKVGDECFNESENIIDIVDNLPSDCEFKLVPNLDSSKGKLVQQWRQKINSVNVGVITYGVMLNKELSPGGLDMMPVRLRPTQEGLRVQYENSIKEMERNKEKEPDLKESFDRKIGLYKERLVVFSDKARICKVLDETESIMDEIEQQLCRMCSDYKEEYWLCGDSFTAADIGLTVLLGRFNLLGLLPRFADPKRFPTLVDYWRRVQLRPAVKKVVLDNVSEVKKLMMARTVRKYGGLSVGVGVVAVGVWLVYRYVK